VHGCIWSRIIDAVRDFPSAIILGLQCAGEVGERVLAHSIRP
jgi:hypothetical protein